MTVTFFSNALNDHQLPFCLEIIRRIGENNFRFVASEPIGEERRKCGFEDMNEMYPFVLKEYGNGPLSEEARRLVEESDVVLIGAFNDEIVENRIRSGKLTLFYSEHIFKQGWRRLDPRMWRRVLTKWSKFRNRNLYTLCASSRLSSELTRFGYPREKCLKWGYFPLVKEYATLPTKEEPPTIIWVGRLIGWKHPEVAVEIAAKLMEAGYSFRLQILGTGPEEAGLRRLIDKRGLKGIVEMVGAVTPAEVRTRMERAGIFLFTSDRNEGWGVVVNEAMNSACAVVANRAAGAVGFMVRPGENGLVFGSGSEALRLLRGLLDDPSLTRRLAAHAYESVLRLWNAKVAAARFIDFCGARLAGKEPPRYREGPMSPA